MESWMLLQRVRAGKDQCKATIRYIGQVEGSKGEWLGVEWDQPSRGRHDGLVRDKRYFSCANSRSGSFVRPDQCSRAITLLDAVKAKYADQSEAGENFLIGKNTERSGEFRINVEFVGESRVISKQSQIENLLLMSVHDTNVDSVDENFSSICPNATEIDLENTLLTDWNQLLRLPASVSELRLGRNLMNLDLPEEFALRLEKALPQLRVLMVNDIQNIWSHVSYLSSRSCFSRLEQLYLCDNNLRSFPGFSDYSLSCLKLLDLTGNAIGDWHQLSAFARLHSLTELVVNNNYLSQVGVITAEDFKSLVSLSLYGNKFSTIDAFDQLQNLNSLTTLRVQNNPFEATVGASRGRRLLIGLLSGLTILNRSQVTRKERKNSELEFINYCSTSAIFKTSRRHITLLSEYHDAIHLSRSSDQTLRDSGETISLTLRSNLPASMTMVPVVRNVLPSMSVALLLQLSRRVFKIDPAFEVDLYYFDSESAFPMLLHDHEYPLEYYSIATKSEIIIEAKEPVNGSQNCCN
uniref:CAP-Gly domain-containing protein n=1 Tax=Spongospora subterranea TaxID=70186 RepID=A0A0H5RQP3_9EUKA|eukprot:CRZ11039.1 hypothetical protein [Spongospora subterranea]